jgi:hypothetical protein
MLSRLYNSMAKLFLAVDPVSKQVEKNEESINKNVNSFLTCQLRCLYNI